MSLPTFAALFAADPHAPLLVHARAQMRAASEAERRAAERKMRRAALGGCECGDVTGEAVCPLCDDGAIPEWVRDFVIASRARERAKMDRDAIAKLAAAGARQLRLHAPRAPNRHERRARRPRRWRG